MLNVLVVLLLSLHTAFAQFDVNYDKSEYGPGDEITVIWDDTYSSQDLSKQTVAVILLCTCNTTAFNCKNATKNKLDITETGKTTIDVNSVLNIGEDGPYMIQFVTSDPNSKEYTISYSQGWFNLSGMTGSQPAGNKCQIPYAVMSNFPNTARTSTVSWPSYTLPTEYQNIPSDMIPYTWQKGSMRYAKMQGTPDSTITVTSTPTRRYPTSSVSIFTTYFFNSLLPITTITPSPAITMTQYPNFAPTIATTPHGRVPTRIMAEYDSQTSTSTSSKGHRRRRWSD